MKMGKSKRGSTSLYYFSPFPCEGKGDRGMDFTEYGGEGGIRTHGSLAATHAFQACLLGHSSTSPVDNYCIWRRRGWDSNPRSANAEAAFRERHHEPLGHLSSVPINYTTSFTGLPPV